MKRGWISWDHSDLPPSALHTRLMGVRKVVREQELSALVVYADVWRSNQARYYANFMPYWNRSLLVIPQADSPILICGLSPRVYPWIRSISVIEDIRPGGNLARQFLQLSSDHDWKRVGILDLPKLPADIHDLICSGEIEIVDVPSPSVYEPGLDEREISIRRHAAKMARNILTKELTKGIGIPDFHFVGRLEREFRRAGAEDLVILLSHGKTNPVPPTGAVLGEDYSVSIAIEFRGHWVRISRPNTSSAAAESIQNHFHCMLRDLKTATDAPVYLEKLSGSYPYEACDRFELACGSIFALHVESNAHGHRLFYGDSCWHREMGAELL